MIEEDRTAVLQSGLLHLLLKYDAQQQEQRTQNAHAAKRGSGELLVPLFVICGGLPDVYGAVCAAALRGAVSYTHLTLPTKLEV